MRKLGMLGLLFSLYTNSATAEVPFALGERYTTRTTTDQVNGVAYQCMTVQDHWEVLLLKEVDKLEEVFRHQDDHKYVHLKADKEGISFTIKNNHCGEWGTKPSKGEGPDVEYCKYMEDSHERLNYDEIKNIHKSADDNLCFAGSYREDEIDFVSAGAAAGAVEQLQTVKYIYNSIKNYQGPDPTRQAKRLERAYQDAVQTFNRLKQQEVTSRRSVHEVECFDKYSHVDGTYDLDSLKKCLGEGK